MIANLEDAALSVLAASRVPMIESVILTSKIVSYELISHKLTYDRQLAAFPNSESPAIRVDFSDGNKKNVPNLYLS
jgi:hypothetical protein